MDVLNYFVLLILSFLGLFVGILLAHLTKEEYKQIEKYLKLAVYALILIISITTLMFFGLNLLFSILLLVLIGFTLYWIKIPSHLLYIFLGIVFYLSSYYETLLFLNAFFIFTLGIPSGTLFLKEDYETHWYKMLGKITLAHSPYFVIPLVFFLL